MDNNKLLSILSTKTQVKPKLTAYKSAVLKVIFKLVVFLFNKMI